MKGIFKKKVQETINEKFFPEEWYKEQGIEIEGIVIPSRVLEVMWRTWGDRIQSEAKQRTIKTLMSDMEFWEDCLMKAIMMPPEPGKTTMDLAKEVATFILQKKEE